jgi:hypothetical protein
LERIQISVDEIVVALIVDIRDILVIWFVQRVVVATVSLLNENVVIENLLHIRGRPLKKSCII